MSTYKKMVTRRGDVHFFKDGSVVEPKDVPVGVHALLAGDETKEVEFDEMVSTQQQESETVGAVAGASSQQTEESVPPVEEAVQQEKTERTPVVAPTLKPADRNNMVSYLSGEPATKTRWLNSIEYPLTDEEYKTLNLGKLAQAVREKDEQDRLKEEK